MIDQETKAEFVLFRAQGLKFEVICEKIKVSKPTLIKWNKEFADNIKSTKFKLLEELIENIYMENREYILNLLETLTRTQKHKKGLKKAALKAERRAYKKLDECFKLKIKSITLTLTKNYDLKEIKIEC